MRSTRFRLATFALILFGLGATLLGLPRQTAAQPDLPVKEPKKPSDKPDSDSLEKISFPENKQTNEWFRGLMDYADPALVEKNWKNLFVLAQKILDGKSDYFFQYTDGPDKGQRRSVKEETNRIIGALPKEGLEYYQLTFGPVAETQLKLAKDEGYDRPRLAEIAQRFYHTKAGAEAALLLAAVYLESGNYPEAAYGYRRLLARPDADKILDPRSLFRAAVALRRAGDGKQTDEVAAVWEKLEKKFPREGLAVGRKAYTVEMLKAELDRPVASLFGSVGGEFVAGKGGDNSRNAAAEAGVPFLQPEYTRDVMYNAHTEEQRAAKAWLRRAIDEVYKGDTTKAKKAPLVPSGFPVTAPNLIIFRGYDGVYAFYSKDVKDAAGRLHTAGDLAWFTTATWGATHIFQAAVSGETGSGAVAEDKQNQEAWLGQWRDVLGSVMFENPLAGSLSHDGKRVYFVDDFNIPPPTEQFNPNMGWGQPQAPPSGVKVSYNRLVAVEIDTGKMAWHLGEPSSGERVENEDAIASAAQLGEGAYFLGPPVTVNGKLYALLERDGAVKLACFDPAKESPVVRANPKPGRRAVTARQPELVWVQNLGRANTPLKQDSARRFQGAFLASADGVMVCPTNSGAVVAVDLNARSLLWAFTYATEQPKPNQPWGGGMVPPGGVMSGGIKPDRWRASAPVIAGGRVVVSAYDGGAVQCLDLRTGNLLWEEKKKTDDLYVGGIVGDKVLIVGKTTVRAVKLIGEAKPKDRTGVERATAGWEGDLKIATPIGHGVAGKDGLFYIPVIGDPDKPTDPTPGVLTVNVATGKVNSYTPYRRKDAVATGATGDPRLSLGNLVFHDGLMFSQSATDLTVFQLNEVKRREVQVSLDRNPNDPAGLFSRGELSLEAGKLQAAIDDFKLAEKNNPDEATAKRIKQKLYVAYTEKIRNAADFAAVEPILDEYKGLCEFPLDADSIEYGRQREEQVRRRGLFYNLLADGREKQGRLVDAFRAYRAYAGLGEKNKMLPVPEDPTTLALPEVWAAGRIDAMMRKASPAARKPLDDEVAKEWEEVKGANDLDRLRGFAKAFGAYFDAGRDAQYLLADKLSGTNTEDARREAQNLLLNLSTQAEDDRDATAAARATDALARVLTDRGMTDDALGLYRRIADRFPTAVVRDGKTGADVLGELIADKRYLPSLEADRPTPMGRYKVEAAQNTGVSRQPQSSLTLVTDGGAMPFFKRNRVTFEYDVYGQQSGKIVVTDRVTNESKFTSEAMPIYFYTYNGGLPPNSSLNNQRLAQVSGHLMLLHLVSMQGNMVYCYDLTKADGKPLWKVNLHGPNWPPPNMQQNVNWMHEVDPTGDMIATPSTFNQFGQQSTDWAFRLGRSMVLQPGYATVLTKEGMVTRDPRTGTVLWQRAGVAQRSLVFGDARHLFLVEPAAQGYTSRVFRAVDGVQVAKVPDFGDLAMGKGGVSRLHILGRNLLVFEGTGKDKPKVLRLYDCLEGKDVWSKEYPADSAAFDTLDPELTGVVSADGTMDILSSRTGQPLQRVTADAKKVDEHVKDAKGKFNLARPLLLADADRFYAFLNRDPRSNPNQWQNGPEQSMGQPSPVRARAVNGVGYAFDRGSGKRLWYMETEFLNQRLIVERFDDLPCLLVTNPMFTPDPNTALGGKGFNPGTFHRVSAVDKANGAVREQKELQSGNWMQGVGYDPKTGALEFGGTNTQQRLTVTPTTPPLQAKK